MKLKLRNARESTESKEMKKSNQLLNTQLKMNEEIDRKWNDDVDQYLNLDGQD